MTWNVAYVKHQREFAVVRELTDADIPSYAPARKLLRRPRHLGSGKPIEITQPLFSRYIFFQGADDEHIYNYVMGIKDVIGIVRFGEAYARIRDKDMVRIMDLISQGIYDEEKTKPVDAPPVGSLIRIIKGPFEGKSAIISRHTTGKAVVVVTASGRALSVSLPWDQIE